MNYYIVKTVSRNNVFIKDLNINVYWNDPNGVKIERCKFDKSKDAKIALQKNQIYINRIEGDYSEAPDKNVVETELELDKLSPYENMLVYIRNYNGTDQPAMAMYINGEWKIFSVGSGSGGSYIHPSTHPATMIVQDSTHKFVTDTQISNWDNKSNFDGDYNKLTNKPSIPTKTSELSLDNVYDKTKIDSLLMNKSDLTHKHVVTDITDLEFATTNEVNNFITTLCKR